MYMMIVLVLDDPDRSQDILDAWEAAGITGVTIMESSGLGRVRRAAMRDDLPLMPSLGDLLKSTETRHRTLFTIVKSQETIDAVLEATQAVIGDLEQPNTGLLFVLPVSRVHGKSKLQ
jgi:nitrogen regulatory protein PII